MRAGYAAMIGVLVVSAVEAYRIQVSVSEQHLEIYRHYVEQDVSLATLRRNLWQAGSDIRDFFIKTTPMQADVLRAEIKTMKAEDEAALQRLARSSIAGPAVAAGLRRSLNEFWAVAEPLPDTMLHEDHDTQFAFLQNEIVPRRGELYSALLQLGTADQQRLQQGEWEFEDARRRAAEHLVIMLTLSILLSTAVALLSLRHAEHLEQRAERHYAEVEQTKHELQDLSARLLEVEEEDRRRLSRELHDEIGQTLALLQIEISHAQAQLAGQPGPLRERLQRAREMAEKTVQTVRNISVLLRPSLLDDLGLVPALQFQLEDFLRRNGITCEFVEEGVADQLPDEIKTCVYRVVQEALHNAEKHSCATRVRVSVRQSAQILVAEVEDNGRGFAANQKRSSTRGSGLGLLGMRERAAIVGGTLAVDAAPGRGTRITLRIPVAATAVPPSVSLKEVTA